MTPQTVEITPQILKLSDLHPRIAAMVLQIWRHQQVILAYETGALVLNFNGPKLKAQLDKLALNSCKDSHP